VGLKFKYQFTNAANDMKKLRNTEDGDEPISKKIKITDNKLTSILEYSSVQLPVTPFIDYLEQHSDAFVKQCLKYGNSQA
jgi:hypothetical protein